jgi:transcriptional regulator with XRE-family HTH domain
VQPKKNRRRKSSFRARGMEASIEELKSKGVTIHPSRKWRKGKKDKWLPSLRKIIRKSAEEFAAMLGVKLHVITNIENGRQKITTELAQKIYAATGVCIWSYFGGNDVVLAHGMGPEYTYEYYEHWRSGNFGMGTEKSYEEFRIEASDTLSLVIQAAKECGSPKNRLPALRVAFQEWCCKVVNNCDLEKTLNTILKRDRKYIKTLARTYKIWRQQPDEMKRFWGFKDEVSASPNTVLELSVELHPQWSNGASMFVPKRQKRIKLPISIKQ